jgi:hypothetical protein
MRGMAARWKHEVVNKVGRRPLSLASLHPAKEVISMVFQEPELKKVSIRRAAVKL